jgi:hypothetical protein
MKVDQTSVSDAAHAMHPEAPLTTERPVLKYRPTELSLTEMVMGWTRRRTLIALSTSRYQGGNEISEKAARRNSGSGFQLWWRGRGHAVARIVK